MTGVDGNYLLPGVYSIQLRHWQRSFPLEQFYITTAKAFGEATAEEMRRIGRHIGLSERELSAASEAALRDRKRVGRQGGGAGDSGGARGGAGGGGAGSGPSGPLSSRALTREQRAELERFYAPYNEDLSRLLKREIDW